MNGAFETTRTTVRLGLTELAAIDTLKELGAIHGDSSISDIVSEALKPLLARADDVAAERAYTERILENLRRGYAELMEHRL